MSVWPVHTSMTQRLTIVKSRLFLVLVVLVQKRTAEGMRNSSILCFIKDFEVLFLLYHWGTQSFCWIFLLCILSRCFIGRTTRDSTLHFFFFFKETVHPKMNSQSSFTHPQVDPNLYECVCSEHKGRYSEEWEKQQYFSPIIEVNGAPKQPDYNKISSFVFRTNTFIQVWIYLRMSKWWQSLDFWVYCPFKDCSRLE